MDKKEKKESENLGVSGFTLGIVSLVLVLFIPLLGIISSIVGFIFCFVQQKKRKPTKTGKIGWVLNIAGFLINIVWWIILIKYVVPMMETQLATGLAA